MSFIFQRKIFIIIFLSILVLLTFYLQTICLILDFFKNTYPGLVGHQILTLAILIAIVNQVYKQASKKACTNIKSPHPPHKSRDLLIFLYLILRPSFPNDLSAYNTCPLFKLVHQSIYAICRSRLFILRVLHLSTNVPIKTLTIYSATKIEKSKMIIKLI